MVYFTRTGSPFCVPGFWYVFIDINIVNHRKIDMEKNHEKVIYWKYLYSFAVNIGFI